MTLLVNMIGAGNLGKTIAHLLVKHQLIRIGFICNQSEASSINAIQFIGQGNYASSISELQAADITFITTPDDQIALACEKLNQNKWLKPGSMVLHCSGTLSSELLSPLKRRHCYIASVHPMKSFASPQLSIEQYSGTYCAIEGDEEALPYLHSLFNSIGSITYEINKRKKSMYHAGGVFSSNYLVTLAEQALSCLKESGVENELAMRIVTNNMRGTLSNLEKTSSTIQSLTGPLQRGDVLTITKHMESLINTKQKGLYSILGKATLHLTNHDKEKKEKMEEALT